MRSEKVFLKVLLSLTQCTKWIRISTSLISHHVEITAIFRETTLEYLQLEYLSLEEPQQVETMCRQVACLQLEVCSSCPAMVSSHQNSHEKVQSNRRLARKECNRNSKQRIVVKHKSYRQKTSLSLRTKLLTLKNREFTAIQMKRINIHYQALVDQKRLKKICGSVKLIKEIPQIIKKRKLMGLT